MNIVILTLGATGVEAAEFRAVVAAVERKRVRVRRMMGRVPGCWKTMAQSLNPCLSARSEAGEMQNGGGSTCSGHKEAADLPTMKSRPLAQEPCPPSASASAALSTLTLGLSETFVVATQVTTEPVTESTGSKKKDRKIID